MGLLRACSLGKDQGEQGMVGEEAKQGCGATPLHVESKRVELIEPESRTVVTRDRGGEMERGWSRVHTSGCKRSKFWGSNVQCNDYS